MAAPGLSPAQLADMRAHNDEDQGPRNVVVCSLLIGISTTAVILRLISRYVSPFKLWWDDFFCVLGLMTACGFAGDAIYQAQIGVGRHVIAVSPDNLVKIRKAGYGIQILYPLTLSFTKFSILLYYWRLFPTKGFRRAVMVVAAVVLAWDIEVTLVTIFQCKPIAFNWNKKIQGGKCLNLRGAFSIANAPPNIGIDIVLLAMPIGKIWRLNLRERQKWALSGIFLLGGFIVACSAVRLYYLATLDFVRDPTFNQSIFHIWGALEPSAAVICACLPTLKPLLRLPYAKTKHSDSPYGSAGSRSNGPNATHASSKRSNRFFPQTRTTEHDRSKSDGSETSLKSQGARQDSWADYPYSTPNPTGLNPDGKKRGSGSQADVELGEPTDSLPMNRIKVQNDVVWKETKPAADAGGLPGTAR